MSSSLHKPKLTISILTIFPDIIKNNISYSIIKRALKRGIITIKTLDIRMFATDKHKSVDDRPYGGGAGMIMKVDVLYKALEFARKSSKISKSKTLIILLDPIGQKFTQKLAESLTKYKHIVLIAGHYEGYDYRIHKFVDKTISVGDYILTGGELPALIISDCVTRLIPGVVSQESLIDESFSKRNLLEYPQYTKPRVFKKMTVPAELLSGNHKKISIWKNEQAQKITSLNRPDLT